MFPWYHVLLSHSPVESELTLCPEEVDVVLELEFEHIVLGDVVTGGGGVHVVAEQGQGRQGEVVLSKMRDTKVWP